MPFGLDLSDVIIDVSKIAIESMVAFAATVVFISGKLQPKLSSLDHEDIDAIPTSSHSHAHASEKKKRAKHS